MSTTLSYKNSGSFQLIQTACIYIYRVLEHFVTETKILYRMNTANKRAAQLSNGQ